MSTRTFDFYYDFGSPAAWLAYTQLSQLTAATGAKVMAELRRHRLDTMVPA